MRHNISCIAAILVIGVTGYLLKPRLAYASGGVTGRGSVRIDGVVLGTPTVLWLRGEWRGGGSTRETGTAGLRD